MWKTFYNEHLILTLNVSFCFLKIKKPLTDLNKQETWVCRYEERYSTKIALFSHISRFKIVSTSYTSTKKVNGAFNK